MSETLPLRPYGDRVLIQADEETHAPTRTAAGILTATTLASAVDGEDRRPSWFVGTVVAIGPEVQTFEIRPFVLRRLQELVDEIGDKVAEQEIVALRREIEALPTCAPETVHVGDRVTFSWASGQQITVDGTPYLILRVSEILGVLEAAA